MLIRYWGLYYTNRNKTSLGLRLVFTMLQAFFSSHNMKVLEYLQAEPCPCFCYPAHATQAGVMRSVLVSIYVYIYIIIYIYYIPSPLTVHFPMTRSMIYQPILHTLYYTLHTEHAYCLSYHFLNNVVITTVIEMV